MKKFLVLSLVVFSISNFVTFAGGFVFGIDPAFIFDFRSQQTEMTSMGDDDFYYDYDGNRFFRGGDFGRLMVYQMDDYGTDGGAYVGYRFENLLGSAYGLMPYLSYKRSEFSYSWVGNEIVDNNSGVVIFNDMVFESETVINTIGLGLKFWFLSSDDIQAFANFQYLKPIFTGERIVTDLTFSQDEKERLASTNKTFESVSMSSYEISLGAEYFFTKSFSLGAEYGIRINNIDWTYFGKDYYQDPDSGMPILYDTENAYSLSAKPTFARLTLNFYF